jgi:hypothetical protein
LADDGTKFVSVVLSGRAADVFKTAEMINGIVNVCLAVSSFPARGISLAVRYYSKWIKREGSVEARREGERWVKMNVNAGDV